jgi:hypothetical protein
MEVEQRVALLEKAMAVVRQLSPHYDDVLREVSDRIDASGSVGKSDIATLAFWKRIPTDSWAESFLCLSEARVREVTAPVVEAAKGVHSRRLRAMPALIAARRSSCRSGERLQADGLADDVDGAGSWRLGGAESARSTRRACASCCAWHR